VGCFHRPRQVMLSAVAGHGAAPPVQSQGARRGFAALDRFCSKQLTCLGRSVVVFHSQQAGACSAALQVLTQQMGGRLDVRRFRQSNRPVAGRGRRGQVQAFLGPMSRPPDPGPVEGSEASVRAAANPGGSPFMPRASSRG